MFHNIEKSGFVKGEYVGYCEGRIFHIRRGFEHGWRAIEIQPGTRLAKSNGATFYGRTLRDLSHRLEELNPNSARAIAQAELARKYHAFA